MPKFELPSFVALLPEDVCVQLKRDIQSMEYQLFDARINDPQYAVELEESLEEKRLQLLEHGCGS